MKFETYGDMSTEIERRTCVLDAAIANMLCLYNAASFFMIMINILIFIIISGFVFLTHVFDGYKLIVYALYVSVVMWEMYLFIMNILMILILMMVQIISKRISLSMQEYTQKMIKFKYSLL